MIQISNLLPIPADWERLRLGVDNCLEDSAPTERLSFDVVVDCIGKGQMTWFVCRDGDQIIADFVTSVTIEDDIRILNFPIMFGKDMNRWIDAAFAAFKDIAVANRCDRMRLCTYKPGIARLYSSLPVLKDWERIYLFETEVNHGRK